MDSNKKFSMEEIIRNSEEITMDTASLMEIDSLKRMVDKYREVFLNHGKMIIIPAVVCQELVRHLTSDIEDKREKADKALKIIRNNGELFTVELAEYSSEEIRKAFADREILLRLSSARANRRQLLITNDRKLSRDAYNLNLMESCSGKTVFVCYLTYCGDLCRCDCSTKNLPEAEATKIIVKKEPVYVEVEKKRKTSGGDILGWIIGGSVIFGAGYGTCKYGKIAVNAIKNLI